MFKDINQQLEEAKQGVFRYQKIEAMLSELNQQKTELESKTEQLKEQLEKEEVDVKKLEDKGLAYIFYSVLGKLEEKLQKEQQEALAARLKYDQANNELDYVNKEIEELTKEKKLYTKAERTYKELYERKKSMLLETNSQTANKLLSLTDKVNDKKLMLKEIDEAISAGSVALHYLNNAVESLDSAENWGVWDIMGGGLLADIAKHGHIDDAKEEVEKAQKALSRFRTELADVRINSDISIETDGFAKFADFFFDGLIADWCMQSKIKDSLESVSEVKRQVETVLSKLRSMKSQYKASKEQLENQIQALVEQAK